MKRLIIVLAFGLMGFALGSACAGQWHPERVLYQPPDYYQTWWNEVGDCLGMSGNMDRVTFFVVPNVFSFEIPGVGFREGLWQPPHNIYFAQFTTGFEKLVKHEFVHEFLRPGHRADPRFLECSGLPHFDD